MELSGIKNIIFDLGGVLININHNLTIKAFKALFLTNYPLLEKDIALKNTLEKYETAELSTAGFISFFKKYNPQISKKAIVAAWNCMLLDIPKERIALLKKLASQYRIFLLSNTNEIHLQFIDAYVKKQFKLNGIADLVEKAYYSHQMGIRKPTPKIFEAIMAEQQLLPQETLFIDDAEEHIISAKKLNLKTHHLIEPETIIELFNVN